MKKRGFVITAWLVVGHAILGALYWGLLQIPESNVLMLGTSLLIVVAMIAWAGVVENVALIGWANGGPVRAAVTAGVRRVGWVIPALAVFVAIWLVTGFAENWLVARRGEIDAWFIARFGWADVSWFHTTAEWFLWFVRYGIGVSLAVAWLAAAVVGGVSSGFHRAWMRRGFSWKTLLITTAALLVGFFAPWQYVVFWRPKSLPPTWVQPAFATAKLAVAFVVANVAWAVVLWWAARQAAPKPPSPSGT